MKALIVTGALCAATGTAIGWIIASDHYEAKASREQDAYVNALAEVNQRVDHYQSISEEYYADYQEATYSVPYAGRYELPVLVSDGAGNVTLS